MKENPAFCESECEGVSGKEEGDDVIKALQENVDMIIFTGRMAKKPYVAKMMIHIDVWIDDNPFAVYNDMQPLPYSSRT